MAITAGNVIEEARELHTLFDEQRHLDSTLRRFLTRYQRVLIAEVARRRPALIVAIHSEPLPLTSFAAGFTVPANQYVSGAFAIDKSDANKRSEIMLLPYGQRFDPAEFPAMWLQGTKAFLRGRDTDWNPYGQIDVSYIPTGSVVTTNATVLVLPDSALDALVQQLGAFMARREPQRSDINVGEFVALADSAEKAFLNEVSGQRRAEVLLTREVFP